MCLEFAHAWLEDRDGDVIDLTWRPRPGVIDEYLGVAVPDDLLRATILKHECYAVLRSPPWGAPNLDLIRKLEGVGCDA